MKRALTMVALVAMCATLAWADYQTKELERVQASEKVLKEIMTTPDKGIPEEILGSADCVAIVPSYLKGGFIVGGSYGKGVATCRTTGDHWSAPAPIRLTGGSFGLQIGGQAVDLVMLIMNKDGMENLLKSKFKIGVDASAAAGPVGRHAAASTDWKMRAQVLTYSRARGAFAGVTLDGAAITQDKDDTHALYGKNVTFENILTGKVRPPKGTHTFLAEVAKDFTIAKSPNREATARGKGTTGGTAASATAPANEPTSGQQTNGSVAAENQTAMPGTAGTEKESGMQVRTNIENALGNEPGVSMKDVHVSVAGNTVMLTGSVPTEKDKAAIRRIAEENSGGRKVDDSQLVVK